MLMKKGLSLLCLPAYTPNISIPGISLVIHKLISISPIAMLTCVEHFQWARLLAKHCVWMLSFIAQPSLFMGPCPVMSDSFATP